MIVAEPGDALATELAHLATSRGAATYVADVVSASMVLTLSIDADRIDLTPLSAIFLRPPPEPLLRPGFDEAFVRGESVASLWAAAALTPAPVINRPTTHGFSARAASSAVVVERRAGLPAGPREVFSSEPPDPPPGASASDSWWCVQDLFSHVTTRWPDLPSDGPFRARQSDADPIYELVAVLDEQGWRASPAPLEHLELELLSVRLLAALELTFGVVIWSISPSHAFASVARVEPFPPFDHVRFVWSTLGPALVDALLP